MANVSLSEQDIADIAAVVATEADPKDTPEAYQATIEAVVDVVMNRMSSPSFDDSVRDVVNEKSAFSAINGPKNRDYTVYGSVQAAPRASTTLTAKVRSHITERTRGKPSTIGTSVNYANRNFSDKKNITGWIDPMIEKGATAIGTGQRQQHFGTAAGNMPGFSFNPSFAKAGPAIDPEYQTARAGTYEASPLGMPTPTSRPDNVGRANGILDTFSKPESGILGSVQSLSPSTPSFDTPQASYGPTTDMGYTPMSRAQTRSTPADPLGAPMANRQALDAIGSMAPKSDLAASYSKAPESVSFDDLSPSVLEGYQEYARARAPGIAPIAAPAPITPSVRAAPKHETSIASIIDKIAKSPSAITGVLGSLPGLLGKVDFGSILDGPSNISAANGNIMSNEAVAAAAMAGITNPTAHTTPNGGVNYSGTPSNFPGMDRAVTNDAGVTTVTDDNHSFIDRTRGASPGAPGGPSLLCTHYWQLGWMDDKTYAWDQLYGFTTDPDVIAGYHRMALPTIRHMKANKWLERALWPLVSIWAHSMAKPNTWHSKVIRWTGETICKLTAPKARALNV